MADTQERDPRRGMGEGRQGTRRAQARREGNIEEAERLAPPSERKLADDERCGALTKGDTPCRSRKGSATAHPGYGNCSRHGGNTEAGNKSAMREMGRDLAARYKANRPFGGSRHDPSIASLTPEQALLEEVRRSAAFVRFLEERIGQWNLTSVQADTIERFASITKSAKMELASMRKEVDAVLESLDPDNPDSPAYLPPLSHIHPQTGITSFTDAREWLYLYREERGHLARVAKMCIDAGVANRLVSLAEDQGRILATALRAVLTALDLDERQRALVPYVVPPILRAVASDLPLPDLSLHVPAELATISQGVTA